MDFDLCRYSLKQVDERERWDRGTETILNSGQSEGKERGHC